MHLTVYLIVFLFNWTVIRLVRYYNRHWMPNGWSEKILSLIIAALHLIGTAIILIIFFIWCLEKLRKIKPPKWL